MIGEENSDRIKLTLKYFFNMTSELYLLNMWSRINDDITVDLKGNTSFGKF